MKRILLSIGVTFFALAVQAQTNLFVDSSISSSGTGTSWGTAYKTLNEALAVAGSGSAATAFAIYIAKGSYFPTGNQSSTNRDSSFFIARSHLKIYGGYQAGGVSRDVYGYPTILSGNIGSPTTKSDNSSHVLIIAGIPPSGDSILLDGLRISDGCTRAGAPATQYNGVAIAAAEGGGMVIKKVECPVIIRNCNFSQDSSAHFAGAVYNEAAATVFVSCDFLHNTAAAAGGALYLNADSNAASIKMDSCNFYSNVVVAGSGGCIYNSRNGGSGAGSSFANCLFGDAQNANSASQGGGGAIADVSVNCDAASYSFCSFSNNTAAYGGALYSTTTNASSGGGPHLKACVFLHNQAASYGGGVAILATGSDYFVDSCVFTNDMAGTFGGGLYAEATGAGNPGSIIRCTMLLDTANTGGGLYTTGHSNLSYNNFRRNSAVMAGGYCRSLSGVAGALKANMFTGNQTSQSGGGLLLRDCAQDTIFNSIFSGNKAGNSGGALIDSSSSPLIVNCTFAGDSANNSNGIENDTSSPQILNCIIWEGNNGISNLGNSSPLITYSTVQGGYPGVGNTSLNPIFTTPTMANAAPTIAGNYELLPCSPAIDAGINTGSYTGLNDLAGNARLFGTRVDQGAYEYQGTPFPAILGPDSITCFAFQYSHVTSGGIWSSSNPSVATISTNGYVTAVNPGIDTISYTFSSGTCTMMTTRVITVTPHQQAVIVGQDSLCSGTGATFNLILSGNGPAVSAKWTSGNVTVGNFNPQSNILNAFLTGSTTVILTLTDLNGCIYPAASKSVTIIPGVGPISPISGRKLLCRYDTLTFFDTTSGGVWSSNDTNEISIDKMSGMAFARASGTDTIVYTITISDGCSAFVKSRIAVDSVNTLVIQNSNELTAVDAFATYIWIDCLNDKTPISMQTGQSYQAPVSGEYAVIINDGVCVDTSACYYVTGLSVPSQMPERGITFSPNPASAKLMVSTGLFTAQKIILVDVQGTEVMQVIPNGQVSFLDVSGLHPGIYIIEVRNGPDIYRDCLSIAP